MNSITEKQQLTIAERLKRLGNQSLDAVGIKPHSSLFVRDLNGEILSYKHFLSPSKEKEFLNSFVNDNSSSTLLVVERVQMPNDLYSVFATQIEQYLRDKGVNSETQKLYEEQKVSSYIYDATTEKTYSLTKEEYSFEKIQMAAIKKDLGNITLIDNPCEEVQEYAAELDPFSVSLYQSSETAQMVAIEHDPTVIVHIDNPSSDLCKAAVEKAFPGVAIDYPFTPVETQSLIGKIKDIETTEERIKIFEEFKNDITAERGLRIEAIQILEGNAPERIFEEKFVSVRNQFPFEEQQLNDSINDIESGIKYSEPRMLSDDHFKKIEIQGSAQYFANQIKKDLTPEELLTFSKELESPLNLPLGKTPTIEEALSLFQNEYGARLGSALYENEKAGRYEVGKATIEYEYKSEELLRAGTQPYSPNYKEVFEKAGLANEFKAFEKACCERAQWSHSYNYAIATLDIAELNDLERKLPSINDKVESSRSLVYSKLNDLYFNLEANKVKATSNLTPEETKRLLEIKSTHSISYNDEDFLKKYNFSAEKSEFDELRNERKNGLVDYGKQYMNEAKTRMRAGFILEENGIISKRTTIRELVEEGWKHEAIKEIHTNLVNEALSSGNSISNNEKVSGIPRRNKTEAELPLTRRELLNMGNEQLQISEVRKNGTVIQLIENPSEKVQLAAVQESQYSLKYIQNPSEKVQLAAVQKYGPAIQHIQNPSEKVQLAAVQERVFSLKYIQNPSEKVQLAAVQKYGSAIQFIQNPSEKVQLAAVQQTSRAIQYINNPNDSLSDNIPYFADNKFTPIEKSILKNNVSVNFVPLTNDLIKNGYRDLAQAINIKSSQIQDSFLRGDESYEIKGVSLSDGRESLVADVLVTNKGGKPSVSLSNAKIYNPTAAKKYLSADGLIDSFKKQGVSNLLDISKSDLNTLIKGGIVDIKTGTSLKAFALTKSPVGFTINIVTKIFKAVDQSACAE